MQTQMPALLASYLPNRTATDQAADASASEAAGEKPDALAIAVTAAAVEAVATGPLKPYP